LYPRFGVYGLSLGVILGALMHFAIQIPVLIKNGFLPKILLKIKKIIQ
jgi:peptidoglycan biosynthesis protein MviN/MurJ (putative lipid II flippase)